MKKTLSMRDVGLGVLLIVAFSAPAFAAGRIPPPDGGPEMPLFVPIDEASFNEVEQQVLDHMPTRQGEPIHQALTVLENTAKANWRKAHTPPPPPPPTPDGADKK